MQKMFYLFIIKPEIPYTKLYIHIHNPFYIKRNLPVHRPGLIKKKLAIQKNSQNHIHKEIHFFPFTHFISFFFLFFSYFILIILLLLFISLSLCVQVGHGGNPKFFRKLK